MPATITAFAHAALVRIVLAVTLAFATVALPAAVHAFAATGPLDAITAVARIAAALVGL